ncbi:MAG: type II toxin-antitoxin system HicA family toxin [Cytophagales bacterium]|nr:type II toxin-antitoxin system HicA family toxin [Cytophagales bacterium]
MKIPRDLSGADLVRLLRQFGYEVSRQTGSYIRLTTTQGGQHHVTVPAHDPLRVGTLSSILSDVASHSGMSKEALSAILFGLVCFPRTG